MSELNQRSIDDITRYMFVPDQILRADATLVLGMTLWERPLHKAIEVYQSGHAGLLVFCGGQNPKLGASEALAMKNRWLELGYASEHVLTDTVSTNTRENMMNAHRLLQAVGYDTANMSLNLISITYHMRRAIETCRAVFGKKTQLGSINYPSRYCPTNSWHLNPQGVNLLLTELIKLRNYLPGLPEPKHILGESPIQPPSQNS